MYSYDLPEGIKDWYDFWLACTPYLHLPVIAIPQITPTLGVLVNRSVYPAPSDRRPDLYYLPEYITARKELYLAGLESDVDPEDIKAVLVMAICEGKSLQDLTNYLITCKNLKF